MSKTITDMVPNLPIRTDPAQAENTAYENFRILIDTLKNGVDGSFTVGLHVITVTKGIITNIT